MSCPQIWNVEKEREREKEKVRDRPEKFNEKIGRERHFLTEEQQENLVVAVRKSDCRFQSKYMIGVL